MQYSKHWYFSLVLLFKSRYGIFGIKHQPILTNPGRTLYLVVGLWLCWITLANAWACHKNSICERGLYCNGANVKFLKTKACLTNSSIITQYTNKALDLAILDLEIFSFYAGNDKSIQNTNKFPENVSNYSRESFGRLWNAATRLSMSCCVDVRYIIYSHTSPLFLFCSSDLALIISPWFCYHA